MANSKTSNTVLIVFIILIVAWAVEMFLFYQTIEEVRETCSAMAKKEAETAEILREQERVAAYHRAFVDRLIKDKEFVEMEARSRLGVAEPGEIVIREEGAERRAANSK